ncbi:MAG TPA: (Fe-S)-binding protein [Fibrobacteraceae bacterium]|nr:(Fe-S)-binding protein [Fibrobacteraceae bacterium]
MALLFMGGLGGLLAGAIALANRKLYVYEDPRIDEVEAMLPGNNCGACGQPGCHAFSESLVKKQSNPAQCTVSSLESKQAIAAHLGMDLGNTEKRVARLACAGGNHVARQRTRYVGMSSCRAAALVAGGGKGCVWGCLGLQDCGRVCKFGAISFNRNGLPVVDPNKCTACGDCVAVCPKQLFSIHPISHRLWVNCRNQEMGEAAEAECNVACIACGKCAMDSASGLVVMKNHLPVVDYELNDFAQRSIIQRCPTGAIVWINDQNQFETGAAAKRVIRKSALPVG